MLMKSRAIITAFHQYQPYGSRFYEPLLDFYLMTMEKYRSEFDKVYIIDSNWGVETSLDFVEVIKVNSNLRYYEAYQFVLPFVKEDLILLLDNDFIIYQAGIIDAAFKKLEEEE